MRFIKCLAASVFFILSGVVAFAGDGIPMGNAIFYPNVEAVYTHTDNLYLQDSTMPSGNMSGYFWQIRPTFGFEFPFKESYFRIDLGYQYQDYAHSYNAGTHSQYNADIKGVFKFGQGHSFSIQDNYLHGLQETTKFDPGYERYWSNTPFNSNNFRAALDFMITQKDSLGGYGIYNIVRFSNEPNSPQPFFDYDQWGGGVLWRHFFRPQASWIFDARYLENRPDWAGYYQVVNPNMYGYNNSRKYDEFSAVTGFEGTLGSKVTGYAKGGYSQLHFHNAFSNFQGFVAEVGLGIQAAEFFKVNVDLFRSPYQSAYNVNNYYSITGGELNLHHQVSRYLFWSAGYRYQENQYPQANWAYPYGPYEPTTPEFILTEGQTRRDKIARAFAEVGYHFNKQFSMRANYRYEDRSSTIHYSDYWGYHRPYSYTENRISLQAQFGW